MGLRHPVHPDNGSVRGYLRTLPDLEKPLGTDRMGKKMTYTLITRKYDVIALEDETGHRIGSFDFTAGASRGTVRGRVVARTYSKWVRKVEMQRDAEMMYFR